MSRVRVAAALACRAAAGVLVALCLLLAAAPLAGTLVAPAWAQASVGSASGLPLPRFVSLRSDQVNLRAGPGLQYPIEWVYRRADLPVEVIDEFDNWRKLRDWEGTEGWVHSSMIQAKRTAQVLATSDGGPRTLRRAPGDDSPAVATLQPNAIGNLLGCHKGWCQLAFGSFEGWLKRDEFFGIHANEAD
ncbi:SH3-like domain-containing protein [Tistlia consotensis]|uniref:SH3-like domain-containing protein n=1 Tax=Tistlia consotensis USBA 355 TaxID=560819 RepID=A0A1Y6BJR0_9PROT|nr:SH3 domain-containing protein [Tistlia consotensis]SMF07342.1 SH3-like domain-containing protein [Tistlia consotensis USBA 355]SNR35936.1 SH3-like domain-containing protein [Tistlia consotensis]